jgi:lipopolysaccharide transport system permease protein
MNHETIIKPKTSHFFLDFKELWHYRELFYILSWRDIKVRFKQTALGVLWVVFQPLVSTVVFTIFFGNLAKIPSGNLPYPLFVFIGLLFWNFFSGSLALSSNSLVDNQNMIKKVYVPKMILPLSALVTNSVDFLINLVLLGILLIVFKFLPSPLVLIIIPFGFIIVVIATAGLGMFLSSLNVKYRDVRHILPFFLQLLLFLTPIIYPSSLLKSSNLLLYSLNPMVGVIENMRIVIGGSSEVNWLIFGISGTSAVIIFLLGLLYFNATEKFFADIV